MTKDELKAFLEASKLPIDDLDAMFKRVDLNADGKLSLGEYNKENAR